MTKRKPCSPIPQPGSPIPQPGRKPRSNSVGELVINSDRENSDEQGQKNDKLISSDRENSNEQRSKNATLINSDWENSDKQGNTNAKVISGDRENSDEQGNNNDKDFQLVNHSRQTYARHTQLVNKRYPHHIHDLEWPDDKHSLLVNDRHTHQGDYNDKHPQLVVTERNGHQPHYQERPSDQPLYPNNQGQLQDRHPQLVNDENLHQLNDINFHQLKDQGRLSYGHSQYPNNQGQVHSRHLPAVNDRTSLQVNQQGQLKNRHPQLVKDINSYNPSDQGQVYDINTLKLNDQGQLNERHSKLVKGIHHNSHDQGEVHHRYPFPFGPISALPQPVFGASGGKDHSWDSNPHHRHHKNQGIQYPGHHNFPTDRGSKLSGAKEVMEEAREEEEEEERSAPPATPTRREEESEEEEREERGGARREEEVVRLLVLGGHGVGKSAITVRYLTRRFIGEYRSQIDIIYCQTILVDGIMVNLEIVDMSTRPGCPSSPVPLEAIRQCDGYLVVYSVSERPTFLTACRLLHHILTLRPHTHSRPPPITLLANKQDLEHSRQVTVEEGRVTSSVFGCAFAEVSAAETSDAIAPIFTSLIRRAQALSSSSCLCPRLHAVLLRSHPGSHCPDAGTCRPDPDSCSSCSCSSNPGPCSQNLDSCSQNLSSGSPNPGSFRPNPGSCNHNSCSWSYDLMHSNPDSCNSNPESSSPNLSFSRQALRCNDSYQNAPPQPGTSCRRCCRVCGISGVTEGGDDRCTNHYLPRNKTRRLKQLRPESDTISKREEERKRKSPVGGKQQAIRSTSSPLQTSDVWKHDDRKWNKNRKNAANLSLIHTPLEYQEEIAQSLNITDESEEEKNKFTPKLGLCRSSSFPDEWNIFRSIREQKCDNNETNKGEVVKNDITIVKDRETRLAKISRGRSLILNTSKKEKQTECYCQVRRHTSSFKSSGQVEIVTIKKPDIRNHSSQSNSLGGNSAVHDKLPTRPQTTRNQRLEMDGRNSLRQEPPHSPLYLQGSSKTPRSPRKLFFDPLDLRSGEDGLTAGTNNRQRKFSVFGRALGSFLSKGSLPDLPRATANICDKFGSLKKTIKKRSV